jgi:hypothetical protein
MDRAVDGVAEFAEVAVGSLLGVNTLRRYRDEHET